jgi:hypothetical protein
VNGTCLGRLSTLLIALLGLSPALVRSATWHVPSGCPTIHAAIDSAASGDTILVAPGTYSISADPSTWAILVPGVSLLSEVGPEATIIEFCGVTVGVMLAEGTRLSGFTIRFVAGSGPDCEHPPAMITGVRSWDCTDATAENCIIEGCDFGITAAGSSSEWWKPVFRNNTIRNCGCAVYCDNMYEPGRPFFQENILTECAGGAYVWYSSPIFDHNQITHCRVYGMYFYGNCTGNCTRNVIAYNGMGVDVWADPPLGAPTFNGSWEPEQANEFYGNNGLDIRYQHPSGYPGMTAIYNYWGSDCPDFDHKLQGEINYSPWMDSTHTQVFTPDDCPEATEPTTWGAIKAMYR